VVFEPSPGLPWEFNARVVAPSQIERSTGTLRSPESTIDLPAELVAQLAAVVVVAAAGPVVGVLVHAVSRRTTVVGVFGTPELATSWWAQPYNKLAHNPDVLFLLVPVVNEVEESPI
jgi:hypothetical protein